MNVGDIKTFTISGGDAIGKRFVWKWWDGTTDTIKDVNFIHKKINKGGDILDGNLLRYSVTVVDDFGNSSIHHGSITVNNPPYVEFSPRLSNPYGIFPYSTTFSLVACDFEGSPVEVKITDRYSGGVVATSAGVATSSIVGTYDGSPIGSFAAKEFSISLDVVEDKDYVALVCDNAGGTLSIPFFVRGDPPNSPKVAVAVSPLLVINDASNVPIQRNGDGQLLEVNLTTNKLNLPPTLSYHYYGTNGWDFTQIVSGTFYDEGNGYYSSKDLKDVSTETAGDKSVLVSVVFGGSNSDVLIPVEIVQNLPPGNISIKTSSQNLEVKSGDNVEYSADSVSDDGDMSVFRWEFSNPSKILHGRTVVLSTDGLSPLPYIIQGYLFATDPLGGFTRVPIPAIQVNSPEIN